MICVFDIETIPDIELIAAEYGLQDKSATEICEHAFQVQLEKTGSNFLPIYWHKIIAIASVICDDYGNFVKVGSFGKSVSDDIEQNLALDSQVAQLAQINRLERCLMEEFLEFLNTKEPRLVSFNGRGFDLPTIMLKAMRYNCSAFSYFETNSQDRSKSKWENYRARYSEYWHTDLLDSLGHFGAVRALKLDSVCKMLGIVGKYDVSGDLVHTLFYEQHDLQAINTYCQSDVLNTYWLYLKYALLKGELHKDQYAGILENFAKKLDSNAPYSGVFINHIQAELERLQHA